MNAIPYEKDPWLDGLEPTKSRAGQAGGQEQAQKIKDRLTSTILERAGAVSEGEDDVERSPISNRDRIFDNSIRSNSTAGRAKMNPVVERVPYTPKKENFLRELALSDEPAAAIAKRINRSEAAMRKRAAWMMLSPPKRNSSG
jgi:hypothetical protein